MRITRLGVLLVVLAALTGVNMSGIPTNAKGRDPVSTLTLPPDRMGFQPGAGRQLAGQYCLICHSADYIYTQPPHNAGEWTDIVNKMKTAFGCPIPNEDIAPLVRYLVNQNSVQPFPAPFTEPQTAMTEVPENDRSSGDPQNGKVLYERNCVACHGISGKGDGPIGQALVPPAANLTRLDGKSDEAILTTLKDGRPGTAMAGWKSHLNQTELHDLLAFLRTLSP